MAHTIALLTDFGTTDIYVGVMKGVITAICPDARIVDITHAIPAHDVRAGAVALLSAYRYFPPDTTFVVVIDPGVGSSRLPIAVNAGGFRFVAPDNGVISYALRAIMHNGGGGQAVELTNSAYRLPRVSQTFHGRDIFAPAAAHLACGVPVTALGAKAIEPTLLPSPRLEREGATTLHSEVIGIDHFGNITTGIGWLTWQGERLALRSPFGDVRADFDPTLARIETTGSELVGIRKTYAEVEPNDALALLGSSGFLEIAVREGSAAAQLALKLGAVITLKIG
ncbi:MAG: SAM-dependent chlorinase/fluorinase [Chloroflexota bacterium]|nr:SAM-dependent chlorinase/fluorinase [Chloroflexota bacterium]